MSNSRRATPHIPAIKRHSHPKYRGWFPPQSETAAEKMDEERPTDQEAAMADRLEMGNVAEREEAAMAKRLEVWVQRHLACLPKSDSSLLRALGTDLCSVKRQIWTADAVFDRLVRLGHIEVVDQSIAPASGADEADNQDSRPRNRDRERPQPVARERVRGRSRSDRRPRPAQLQPRVRVQLVFRALPEKKADNEGEADGELEHAAAIALEKVMRWVERQEAHPKLRPNSVEAAKRALAQLCFVDVGFQPQRLVELLAAKNYLRLEQEVENSKAKKVVWLLKPAVGGVESKRKSEEVGDQDTEHQEEREAKADVKKGEERPDSSARKRVRSL